MERNKINTIKIMIFKPYKLKKFKDIFLEKGIFNLPGVLVLIVFWKYLSKRREDIKKLLKRNGVRKIVIKLFTNQDFLIDLNDNGLSTDLFFYRKREIHSTDFLLNYFKNKNLDLFIDVGANKGYYTILIGKFAKNIVAIEPVIKSYNFLLTNLKLNNLEKKTIAKCIALGNKKEKKRILIPRDHNLARILRDNENINQSNYEIQEVTINTLNNLFLEDKFLKRTLLNSKNILLKMDVEGWELEILKGAEKIIEEKKPMIFLELHIKLLGKEKSTEVLLFLSRQSYRIKKCYAEPPSIWYSSTIVERKIFEKMFRKLYNHGFGEIKLTIEEILNNEDIITGKLYNSLDLILIK